MNADIAFLEIYVEICVGMTAFFAIVATLRQTLGEALTPYQYLVTRYFIDSGLMVSITCLGGLGVSATAGDTLLAWQTTAWMFLFCSGFYQVFYLKKRFALDPPPPRNQIAITVMISSLVVWLNLLVVMVGLSPQSVASAVALSLVVTLAGLAGVFAMFIGSFLNIDIKKAAQTAGQNQ